MNTNTAETEPKVEVKLLLSNGFTISEKLRNQIHELITDLPPGLPSNAKYTLKSLCGSNFWSSLTDGERRSAGVYMAHIVRQGLVPYAFVGEPHRLPKQYRMI